MWLLPTNSIPSSQPPYCIVLSSFNRFLSSSAGKNKCTGLRFLAIHVLVLYYVLCLSQKAKANLLEVWWPLSLVLLLLYTFCSIPSPQVGLSILIINSLPLFPLSLLQKILLSFRSFRFFLVIRRKYPFQRPLSPENWVFISWSAHMNWLIIMYFDSISFY